MLNKTIWCLCSLVLALVLCGAAPGETVLFQSRQLTHAGEYTFGIEGPAVDSAGNLYIVNFRRLGPSGN
jgi:signal peptidase